MCPSFHTFSCPHPPHSFPPLLQASKHASELAAESAKSAAHCADLAGVVRERDELREALSIASKNLSAAEDVIGSVSKKGEAAVSVELRVRVTARPVAVCISCAPSSPPSGRRPRCAAPGVR